jgi:hypothetical protein
MLDLVSTAHVLWQGAGVELRAVALGNVRIRLHRCQIMVLIVI